MANIFTTIQRKINEGKYEFREHFLKELYNDRFLTADAFSAIRRPFNCYTLTEDASHIRYVFEGCANDGRMLKVVVFIDSGLVQFKTVHEI